MQTFLPSQSGFSETAACPVSYCWTFSSAISHLLSLLVTLPACSLDASRCMYASCCPVLQSFSKDCTVRLEMFYLCVCFFMYYLCDKYYKHITVQYYIANFVSWASRVTLLDLGTCSEREQNLLVCRRLTRVWGAHLSQPRSPAKASSRPVQTVVPF